MKLSRGTSWKAVTAAIAIGLSALTVPVLAGVNRPGVAQWSVVVNQVDAGWLGYRARIRGRDLRESLG